MPSSVNGHRAHGADGAVGACLDGGGETAAQQRDSDGQPHRGLRC